MKIIPAIDIINGQCVRLKQGLFENKKIYSNEPLKVAQEFEEAGFKRLHIVDLEGALNRNSKNLETLNKISSSCNVEIDFGGGIKSEEAVKKAFKSGANLITLGSLAVENQNLTLKLLEKYGNKMILGADCNNRKIAVSGWEKTENWDVKAFISFYLEKGFSQVICTDVSKDGMLLGPSFELYEDLIELKKKFPSFYLIASGGVGSIEDLKRLKGLKVDGCIVGKAIYENRISLKDLKELLC